MTAVLAAAVVLLVAVVLVLLWRQRPRPYIEYREQIVVVPRLGVCDACGTEPATVHLVDTFDDAEEREFGGGSTAMRADYCQACADELGVGG